MTASPAPMPNDQPLPLLSLAGYQKFGEYLRVKRQQLGLTQAEMGELFPTLSRQTYGYLERERRAPQAEELVPLFAALVELHADLHFPPMQAIEAQTFFRLGKAAIEHKQRKRQAVSKEQWAEIEQQLIAMTSIAQRGSLRLVASPISNVVESLDSRRQKALRDALNTDVSSLLERETWVQQAISLLDRTPHIKLGVYQGGMGAGKSHALALLTQQLATQQDLFLIPYSFQHSDTMTCDDQLDVFLATLYTDLTFQATDDSKQRTFEERIKHTLGALYAFEKPVVLLLDDAQEIFPSASEWSPSWHLFFSKFIAEPHTTTVYFMTRTWPGWDERKLSFLREEYLPDLSPEAGMQIWKRRGFDDVDDQLLRAICEKCGTNPQIIEMLTFQYRRRSYTMQLGKEAATSTQENTNTRNLKKLLTSDTLFSNYLDAPTRRTLQQVFSSRFSGETRQILEWLAVSPLALPFNLLFYQVDYAIDAYEALHNASYVDLAQAASHRATLVPLVREAVLQSLTPQQRAEAEQEVLKSYIFWLQEGQEFKDDHEAGALIAECTLLQLKANRSWEASQLWIRFGWLAANQGHGGRVARVAQNILQRVTGNVPIEEICGNLLLRYLFPPFLGKPLDDAQRVKDYQHILNMVITREMSLEPITDIHVVHHLMNAVIRAKQYREAETLLQECYQRVAAKQTFDADAQASLLERWGWLYGTWSEHIEEAQLDTTTAQTLREKAIAFYQECKELLQQSQAQFPLQTNQFQKRLARCYNNVGYHLNRIKRFEEAETHIGKSIALKEQGHVQVGSLAASYAEMSIALAGQGRFREALFWDQKAHEDIDRYVQAGYSLSQEDQWMYAVLRGRLYLLLGRVVEAEELLRPALDKIPQRRFWYKMLAEKALQEIDQWRAWHHTDLYQIDWRWIERFRALAAYDSYAWLTPSGPFLPEEEEAWRELVEEGIALSNQEQVTDLFTRTRDREVTQAFSEGREPVFSFRLLELEIDDVHTRIVDFLQLDRDIRDQESNALVRRLYSGAIEEDLWYLSLIEAAYEGDTAKYQHYSRLLNPPPTSQEMKYALAGLKQMIQQGLERAETQAVSQSLVRFLKRRLNLSFNALPDWERTTAFPNQTFFSADIRAMQTISPQAAKRFFDAVLAQNGFTRWQTVIDTNGAGAHIEQGMRAFFIPNKPLTLEKVQHYLAHELAGHVARCVAGENSKLGLLGIHTKNSLLTEEGLAIYYDRQLAQMLGESYDDSSEWIGTLATGLASGVDVPAQRFSGSFAFFELLHLLRRLLRNQDQDPQAATIQARRLSMIRCLRTYRGVPDLSVVGACFAKDALYLRGRWLIENRLAEDAAILERLSVGVVAIEQLRELSELDIAPVGQTNWQLARSSQLAEIVASYEER